MLYRYYIAEETSQRYNQGNVAVRPQDSLEVRSFLPPSCDQLREAMCVVFTGQKEKPSRETIKWMRPVLVTKSRVRLLIEFLIENNPWYQKSGVVYSQKNMDALFSPADSSMDCSVPVVLEVCHLPKDNGDENEDIINFDGPQSRGIQSSREDVVDDIALDAVGFTQGDYLSQSREKMKLHVLAHVLDQKRFLLSRTGSEFVADNDPGLMSYLFLHLDPWDIGAFYHCG